MLTHEQIADLLQNNDGPQTAGKCKFCGTIKVEWVHVPVTTDAEGDTKKWLLVEVVVGKFRQHRCLEMISALGLKPPSPHVQKSNLAKFLKKGASPASLPKTLIISTPTIPKKLFWGDKVGPLSPTTIKAGGLKLKEVSLKDAPDEFQDPEHSADDY